MNDPQAPTELNADGIPAGGRRAYFLAVLVLVGSLAIVALYARIAGEREDELAQARFVVETGKVVSQLRQKLLVYELTSRGGVSLFATVDRPTSRQWRNYVEVLDLQDRFPGMMGLGYAPYLTPGGLERLQLDIRDAGGGLYTVRPPGVRKHYGPILYLEPATHDNRSAIGYDMFSESIRAHAMAAARDTGRPRMTAGVHLVQDADRPNALGVLIYSPVYRSGANPADMNKRREAFVGWVYTLFRMRVFVARALGELPEDLALRIVDVTGSTGQLLYPTADDEAEFEPGPDALRHSVTEEFYGRKWRVDFASVPVAQGPGWRLAGLQATLAIGLIASLLLFGIALSLARTQSRAQRLALRMSESVRRGEERFRNALLYSAIGQALLDGQGVIRDANPALSDILRQPPEDLVGTAFAGYFVDGEEGLADEHGLQVATPGVYQTTRQLLRSDGEMRLVRITFTPVPGETGREVDGLVQVEDVTERLRAEARIKALNRTLEARVALRTRELSQANDELQSFSYSVSHDLSAPLRSIDGFTRLLSERYGGQLDDAGRDYLKRVRLATTRMSELIEALLKMARLSRGELDRQSLDLSQMASGVIAELREENPERDVEVVIQPGLRATGDAELVRNLLRNLLGNAWKFTRHTPGARVEFAASEGGAEDGMRGFVILDNGAGFESEYADKLFRPFQRLHNQLDFEGHGIGLASVKRIVERHGGTISATGAPGEGATFRFSLPA
ncbi:CHASE domain-containing protein [Luteimonas vadosa]|uniref:histidine kinase n=1 Tax=Luteimonas vadosa TaxID=1165507 RepID=A0ABP9E452_9GAMM